MKASPCKGCGKPIVWGVTADGKRIPLDPRPVVYHAVEESEFENRVTCTRVPEATNTAGTKTACYVSHFATCPKASEFGKGRKRDA